MATTTSSTKQEISRRKRSKERRRVESKRLSPSDCLRIIKHNGEISQRPIPARRREQRELLSQRPFRFVYSAGTERREEERRSCIDALATAPRRAATIIRSSKERLIDATDVACLKPANPPPLEYTSDANAFVNLFEGKFETTCIKKSFFLIDSMADDIVAKNYSISKMQKRKENLRNQERDIL